MIGESTTRRIETAIEGLEAEAFTVPTDGEESDGTLTWASTSIVVVHLHGAGQRGIGYTYASPSAAGVVRDLLADVVCGADAMSPPDLHARMRRAIRNNGESGLAAMALSAVDCAAWDLKARLLGLALADLLGRVRDRVRVYASGGFTSYGVERLCEQLAGWVEQGIPRVKMKVGREPEHDVARVRAAREAIGDDAALFVDANGAYDTAEAIRFASRFAEFGVSWFEEPRPSGDLDGLRRVRDHSPAGMEVAAGEYGGTPWAFAPLASAVDVLQADASRCGGITGMLGVSGLCTACHVPLSAHCCPALHAHVAAALAPLRHIEYFHDHVRLERMLFDGTPDVVGGDVVLDVSRPGNGLTLKERDAARWRV